MNLKKQHYGLYIFFLNSESPYMKSGRIFVSCKTIVA